MGLAATGQWAEAERQARNALRENPYCANLHFTLGRQHYLRGEYGEAKAAFTRARDMDRLPFRAPTLFNQILREVASSSNGCCSAKWKLLSRRRRHTASSAAS